MALVVEEAEGVATVAVEATMLAEEEDMAAEAVATVCEASSYTSLFADDSRRWRRQLWRTRGRLWRRRSRWYVNHIILSIPIEY